MLYHASSILRPSPVISSAGRPGWAAPPRAPYQRRVITQLRFAHVSGGKPTGEWDHTGDLTGNLTGNPIGGRAGGHVGPGRAGPARPAGGAAGPACGQAGP